MNIVKFVRTAFFIEHLWWAICKPRHWNLSSGIEIEIEIDTTNSIISSSRRPMDTKPSRLVIEDEGTPPTKSCDTSWQMKSDKIKSVISPLSQDISILNLAGWWLRMRGPHLKIHVTHQLCGHVIIQKRYISTFTRLMSPKLSHLVT